MKPSFALNLTEDGVTLLHRTSRGWMDVGSVAFADPDLAAGLEYLRSTALGLSPTGVTTKLIIPESQILYLQIDAVGPDDDSRRAQIEAALDGRTPYALDELVYDWSGSGATVTVAVVARETLAEAEAFATEHRFNPVSFVAAPERGFDKEPFFGTASRAAESLEPGETVEADPQPVTILAREVPRVAEPAPAEVGEVEGAAAEPEAVVEDGPEAVTAAADVDVPVAEPQAEAEPVVAEQDAPAPERPVPAAFRPGAAASPEVPKAPVPAPPEAVEPEPVVPEPVLPEPVVAVPVIAPPVVASPPRPEPILPEPVPPEPVAPAERPGLAEPERPVWSAEAAKDPAASAAASVDAPRAPAAAADSASPVIAAAKSRAKPSFVDESEAPMAVDVSPEDGDAPRSGPRVGAAAAAVTDEDDDLPPPISSAALRAFSTRRAAEGAPRPLGGAEPRAGRPDPAAAPRPAPPVAARPAGAKPVVERPAGAKPAPKFSYDDPLPTPPPRLPGDPPTPPASVMGKAGKSLRSLGTLVTAQSIPGTRKKKPGPAASPAAPVGVKPGVAASTLAPITTLAAPLDSASAKASVAAAAQSLTRQKTPAPDAIGRGLSARTMPRRGKPRYLGLILTGVLLLLLALVAAWSSFYLTRADDPAPEVEIAGFDPTGAAEALADGQLLEGEEDGYSLLAEPDDLPVNVDLADLAPAPAAPLAEPEPEVAALPEAAAPAVAEPAPQTGVQDVAAAEIRPEAAEQDEIFLAGMDVPPSLSDPLALPAPAARGDLPPAAQMPPPPFGTVYQFDAEGRIVPTPQGIMTPEGVMLIAGKPARLPPVRPAAIEAAAAALAAPVAAAAEPAPAAAPELAASAGTDPLPAETYAADPALSDARPRVRPAGLAPAAPATDAATAGTDDDASLAPAEDSRFASLRPRLRPQAILAAGEAARKASEAASLAVQAAVAEAVVAEDASLSPMAVSVSRVPAPRPRDLSRAVEAAVAAATRRAEPEVVAAAPAARAPAPPAQIEADEAEDEPEVVARSNAPRIPTTANVAKQATFVNAINLGRLNLIGVYGTQSKRYALVRQPNGRYRKVQVGDNIDGGRVQAITASEVRYQKGGRMLALTMPAG
ncbi:hypothetical protein [Pseudotabrizicola algicola]|nr:hypothetical protein [Pseudotabrizicola algicola]